MDHCTAPKKSKAILSANKVMTTVLWDARAIIHVDYLQKGKTINEEYYVNLLERFNNVVKEKRPHSAKKIIFHEDNAGVYICVIATAKFRELDTNCFPIHHIRQIQPSAILFPNMTKWLDEIRFGSNEEMIAETNAYFEGLEKSYILGGI